MKDFLLFTLRNWPYLICGTVVLSFIGIAGNKKHQKSNVSKKIKKLNKEESNIKQLMVINQRKYFSEKISSTDYHNANGAHEKRLAKIRKERLKLRKQRIKLIEYRKVLHELGEEEAEIESKTKALQTHYYLKKNISEIEYKAKIRTLSKRLEEIEEERTALSILDRKRRAKPNKHKKVVKKSIKKAERITLRRIKKTKRKIKREEWKIGLKNFFSNIRRKIKPKKNKKGIMVMDNKILDKLKEEFADKDCAGKYIKLNLKADNRAKISEMFGSLK